MVKNFQSYSHHNRHHHTTVLVLQRVFFLASNFCFFVFFVFVAFLYAGVNWSGGCAQSSGGADEVMGSRSSWWVLQLAGIAAILETAVLIVKCSSVSLKKVIL